MKKILYTILCSLLTINVMSQVIVDTEEWAPTGARWIYHNFSIFTDDYTKFEYVSDTILLGKTVKKMEVTRIVYASAPVIDAPVAGKIGDEYMYESNDSIFWYDKVNNEFDFLYRFNATVGDQFVISNSRARCPVDASFPLSDTVAVISMSVDTFSDRIFSYYETSPNENFQLGTIINNIGCYHNPFPEINPIPCADEFVDVMPETEYMETYVELICYKDDVRGYVQFFSAPVGNDCEHISDNTIGIAELLLGGNVSTLMLYPNPTRDFFVVKNTESPIQVLEIMDLQGKVMRKQNITDAWIQINMSDYAAGVYLVKAMHDDNTISYSKIVKE